MADLSDHEMRSELQELQMQANLVTDEVSSDLDYCPFWWDKTFVEGNCLLQYGCNFLVISQLYIRDHEKYFVAEISEEDSVSYLLINVASECKEP